MQRVLPWTLFIFGLLAGYLVGHGTRPAPAPVPSPSPVQGSPAAPQDLLPFALSRCGNPDCVGDVDLFTATKPSDNGAHHLRHGVPSPSPLSSSHPFSILSNMSANKGGLTRDVSGPGNSPQVVFTITIPEDADNRSSQRRLQTLYLEHEAGKSYRLATCLAVNNQYDIKQYCGHHGETLQHK